MILVSKYRDVLLWFVHFSRRGTDFIMIKGERNTGALNETGPKTVFRDTAKNVRLELISSNFKGLLI